MSCLLLYSRLPRILLDTDDNIMQSQQILGTVSPPHTAYTESEWLPYS